MNRAGYPSRGAAQRYRHDLQDALEVVRKNSVLDMDALAWPAGLDRAILDGLPLQVRTRNCLLQARLMEGDEPLTVYRLLRVANFGRKSLGDLLLAVDDFLRECIEHGSTDAEQDGVTDGGIAAPPPEASIEATSEEPSAPWARTAEMLSPVLAAAAELNGTKTLADVLNPQFMRLAERMGIATEIEGIEVHEMLEGRLGPATVVAMRLKAQLEGLTPRQSDIIEHRLLSTPPKTLEEVAARFDVTRERIRQIQAKVERTIRTSFGNELRIVAGAVKEELGHIADQRAANRQIDELLPEDLGWKAEGVKKLFRQALINKMGLTHYQGMYLDEQALQVLEAIRASARTLADDVGLVDEQQLMASLPSEEWQKFWPWVREHIGLRDVYGVLGFRDSAKARTKAALLSIGRPATREEIGAVCGFDEGQVSAYLSNVPSVTRADKERWGLREWIDDEYDGIVGEIIQRIEEDGGATTTKRLLSELPSKFDVSPSSVRTYMQTPKFVIQDGWISLASTSSIRLRDLDDVIDGRDETGAPYWTFPVDARYFDGYSVPSVPPEFAKALGCAPDAGARIEVENLPDCREMSINWRLASSTGASLGYLTEPLKRLGLEPGQRARVTIKGPRLVELSVDDGNDDDRQTSEADAILERMMQRRRVL